MPIKVSPECKSRRHQFCDIRWKDYFGDEWICDCENGDCHENWGDAVGEGFIGQTQINLGDDQW